MAASIIGVWKLQHLIRTNLHICETVLPYGNEPYGFITFMADGTFSNTVASQDNQGQLIAESGKYITRAKKKVELRFRSAFDETGIENTEIRSYQIDHDVLTIASCLQDESGYEYLETLVWHRWPVRTENQGNPSVTVNA
ncbi:lipocalin-like domain-containing protein [Aurantimicrobium minutum]|uniref:lipocalin-like domain-containing protein n=1 Tax=Aurantimicrobium minutum TaxID=708131 RepID=UPI002476A545|nr:lipocalin-like domain-containing protein [Aurantimicrobium minutum]MDH6422283.1 hypothetical protein [Aurantimicrobium minutum]